MTTFDSDMIRLLHEDERTTLVNAVPCKALGYEWPPPEMIEVNATVEHADGTPYGVAKVKFRRIGISELTDEQVLANQHIFCGAQYARIPEPIPDVPE